MDPAWDKRPDSDVIDAVDRAGLTFDRGHAVGAVLHMLDGLKAGGLLGLTTIGRSRNHAQRLHDAAVAAILDGSAGRTLRDCGRKRGQRMFYRLDFGFVQVAIAEPHVVVSLHDAVRHVGLPNQTACMQALRSDFGQLLWSLSRISNRGQPQKHSL